MPRILTKVDVDVGHVPGERYWRIALHWQPTDDLQGAYVETLVFDRPTKGFVRAQRHYEQLLQANTPVEEPF